MRLVLVRHAAVTFQLERPNSGWHLSPEGRSAADALAENPNWAGIDTLHASPEPKALATAQRIASRRHMRVEVVGGLREVERPWSDSYREEAEGYLRGLATVDWEQAAAALDRVTFAIDGLAAAATEGLAVVSHGLILSLYLSDLMHLSAEQTVELWSSLKFPDIAVVDTARGGWDVPFGLNA